MATDIQQDLMHMLEAITTNAGVDYEIDSLDILLQYQFYFQICQIIFPEMNINLLQISENNQLADDEKLQKLIQLLSRQLQIDLLSISGSEILKGHLIHMHKLLRVLEKFSEYHPGDFQANRKEQGQLDNDDKRCKSDPNTSQRKQINANQPRSARNPRREAQQLDTQCEEAQPSTHRKKYSKSRKPSYSVDKKRIRSKKQQRKNVYSSVINILINQKNRAMNATMRDNRKKKNQDIVQAKNKYKSYLINYKKQTKAARNRKQRIKKPKQVERQLPLQDFQNIQNFFGSFAYKFRDQKHCYLKRISNKIRSQQLDRMCYYNRLRRQQQADAQKKTGKILSRINNEHKIRKQVIEEKAASEKQAAKLMQKQYERYLRSQKKQLKETKKKQLKKIKDFIEQQNRKVLMNLEDGGHLQRVILNMYKRF